MSSSTTTSKVTSTLNLEYTSYRRILKVALPMVVQGLIFTAMLLTDRLFISHYDMESLAAVGTAGDVAMAIGFLFSGTIAFTNDMVAQYYGAQRHKMLASPVWAGLFLAIIFGFFLLGSLPFLEKIFTISFFQHSAELIRQEQIYFRYMTIVQSLGLFQFAFVGFFIGMGQTTKSMIVAVLGNVTNVIFDWLLVFGVWIFPEMGVAGAGLASVLGALVSLLIAFIFYVQASKKYQEILKPRFEWTIIKKLLKFGSPAGLKMGLEAGGYAMIQMSLGKLGVATLAASTISFGLQNFVYIPVVSMATAGAIIVGQERGANRIKNFKIIIRKVLLVTNIYSLIMLYIFWRFPNQLIGLFGSGEEHPDPALFAEIQHIVRNFLLITGLWLIPDAFFNVYMQVLKTLGDGRYLATRLIFSVLFLIILPTLLFMNINAPWVKYAIYGTAVLYVIVLWIMFGLRYRSGKWMKNKVID